MATSTTIGMRIDSIIASMDTIPNAYRVFLAVCIVFAFAVLNSGSPPDATVSQLANKRLQSQQTKKKTKTLDEEGVPQPKWHILKMCNICAVIGFFTSVFYFVSDATTYLNDSNSLLQFLVAWSLFLCYFFGFFGISFIDAEVLAEEAVSAPSTPSNKSRNTFPHEISIKDKSVAPFQPTPNTNKIHPPAKYTPVCSDATSMPTTTPTNNNSNPSNNNIDEDIKERSNQEIANLVLQNKIKDHNLEKLLDPHRAVEVRRLCFDAKLSSLDRINAISELPHEHALDYGRVFGANCETVVGFIPLPVGMVGPLTLNDETVYFPMATTEGCLVASTNRGCKAISQGSGAISSVVRDGITRAPCVRMNSAKEAADLKIWCEVPENFLKLKEAFESTTSFGKLLSCNPTVAGRNVYLRLRCFSGDAMGMNMVSKGSLAVMDLLKQVFPTMVLVALSGNMCTDKKAAAINWIEGRGKSVVVEATIPKDVVQKTLKTNVKTIVMVNTNKNLIGSAMAGAIGGFNAHAANIVTAVFLATGQDPAQNVESSNCITIMEETEDGDLWISCTMPSIEVGTVGGGTSLPAQSACLKMIGCKGGGINPGDNAKQLAHVVAAATMAGELSLLAALSSNTLVQAHMQHNRKPSTK